MNLTNIHDLPQALVDAVRNDPYEGGGDISFTKLIDSAQRRVLLKKFGGTEIGRVRCASFEEWMMGFPMGWRSIQSWNILIRLLS